MLAGALAGMTPGLLFILFLFEIEPQPLMIVWPMLQLAGLTAAFTLALTCIASLAIGLPVDRILRRSGRTGLGWYVAAGGVAGLPTAAVLLTVVSAGAQGIPFFAMSGLPAGVATAGVWHRLRPPPLT